MQTQGNTATITKALDDLMGGGIGGMLAGLFERMDWAEDEIKRAQRHHPAQADLIWHAFKVLTPTHELMGTKFVYQSHCRELLARVLNGQDTRPGTAAEVACACADASQVAPLTETAAGLYSRMWGVAFPNVTDAWEQPREHYEALRGVLIDDLERESRRRLARSDRQVDVSECGGRHHGEPVNCHAAAQFKQARKRTPEPVPVAAVFTEAEADGMLFALTGTEAAA